MRILLYTGKGGVGKTTTAINLGAALAMVGHAVLLIDLDPQGNASSGLSHKSRVGQNGTYNLLMNDKPNMSVVHHSAIAGLSLVPAEPDLAGVELELIAIPDREYRLRFALDRDGLASDFTFILIDCPPSLGLLTLNALVAADAVLVPLQCEFFALEGIGGLMQTLEKIRRHLNPGLRLQGIVLTMFDSRNRLSALVAEDARGFFGDWVYDTIIPRNVRLSEATSHGLPVLSYDLRSAGAQAYARLANELLAKVSNANVVSGGTSNGY